MHPPTWPPPPGPMPGTSLPKVAHQSSPSTEGLSSKLLRIREALRGRPVTRNFKAADSGVLRSRARSTKCRERKMNWDQISKATGRNFQGRSASANQYGEGSPTTRSRRQRAKREPRWSGSSAALRHRRKERSPCGTRSSWRPENHRPFRHRGGPFLGTAPLFLLHRNSSAADPIPRRLASPRTVGACGFHEGTEDPRCRRALETGVRGCPGRRSAKGSRTPLDSRWIMPVPSRAEPAAPARDRRRRCGMGSAFRPAIRLRRRHGPRKGWVPWNDYERPPR